MSKKYTKKLWSRLSELANGPTITGNTPNNKMEFLTLALACGMQLADRLPLADVEGTIRLGTDGTAGEVDVVGNIVYWQEDADGEERIVSDKKFRILFDSPDLSTDPYIYSANFAVRVEPFGNTDLYKYSEVSKNIHTFIGYAEWLIHTDFWWLKSVLDDTGIILDKYVNIDSTLEEILNGRSNIQIY